MFGFHHIDSGDFQIVWISRKFFLSRPTVGTIQSNPRLRLLTSSSHLFNVEMEAIKKKMQAMKVEKDNACDQADVSEEKMKAARVRAQKGEDEVEQLELKIIIIVTIITIITRWRSW